MLERRLRNSVEYIGLMIAYETKLGQLIEYTYITTSLVWWSHCTNNFSKPDYIEMSVSFIVAYSFFTLGYYFATLTAKDIFKN